MSLVSLPTYALYGKSRRAYDKYGMIKEWCIDMIFEVATWYTRNARGTPRAKCARESTRAFLVIWVRHVYIVYFRGRAARKAVEDGYFRGPGVQLLAKI